jgi:mannitol/fructose-specific phosphotransferase system IIA component (Ntr-type)
MSSSLLDGLLDPKFFVPELKGSAASEAIWEIIQRLQASGELRDAKAFFEAVMNREKKSSTVADDGVAYPHARTELIDQIMLGIGRSENGVKFDGSEDLVHLIFVIAVPQQMVNDYLICLGALARTLRSQETREALLTATTPAEFVARLRKRN